MTPAPCSYRNRHGLEIRGLFFDPPSGQAQRRLGIVYLPGFVLGYCAVHRLGLELLAQLSSEGFPGYVFDHAGVGESEGKTLWGTHEELSQHVARGGMLDDTLDALNFFRGARAVEQFLLIGHCGGALTASYAGAADAHVTGMVLLSPPVLEVGELDSSMPEEAVNQRLRLYRKRLTSAQSWAKLLFGRTDYRMLARTLWSKVLHATGRAPDSRCNPRLASAIRTVLRRGQVVVIAGDHDEQIRELNEFMQTVTGPRATYRVLADTSHGFVTDESMDALMREVRVIAGALEGRRSAAS